MWKSLEQLDLGVLRLDRRGRVVEVTPCAAKLLLGTPQNLIGTTWTDVVGAIAINPPESWRSFLSTKSTDIAVKDGKSRKWLRFRKQEPLVIGDETHLVLLEDVTSVHTSEEVREVLLEFEASVLQTSHLPELAQRLCDRITDIFGTGLVWIGSCEKDGTIAVRACAGPECDAMAHICPPSPEDLDEMGPLAHSIREKRAIRGDVMWDDTLKPWRFLASQFGLRHVLSIPILMADHALGVLVLHDMKKPGEFEDESHLRVLANLLAMALHQGVHVRQSHLHSTALDAIGTAVYIADFDGRIQWVNRGFHELCGYSNEEVLGQPMDFLKSGVEPDSRLHTIKARLEGGGHWTGETYNRAQDGSVYLAQETVHALPGPDGKIAHFVGTQADLSERTLHQERIRHLQEVDALTRLPNKQALEIQLNQRLANSEQGTLVMLDIDHFSVVNDTLGHAAGDRVLADLADIMLAVLPKGDFLARWGGDEFSLITSSRIEDATRLAERIQEAVSRYRVDLGGRVFSVSVTVGLTPFSPLEDPGRILAAADAALYAARGLGPGRRWVNEDTDSAPVPLEQGTWATQVQDALAEDRLVLHFQPVVRLSDGVTAHFEALLRLRDRDGELILPGMFIPAAERFGVMPQVDTWVLKQSVRTLQENPETNLFVNISGGGLHDPGHLDSLEAILEEADLEPGRITLEITESSALHDLDATLRWMTRLRDRGCHFALDDFGKGFATFGYLSDLPVDYVKIDGKFVKNIATDTKSHAMVEAIAAMARTLGKKVIAECVEAAPAADLIKGMGIEYGQGYHWGRPSHSVTPTGALPAGV